MSLDDFKKVHKDAGFVAQKMQAAKYLRCRCQVLASLPQIAATIAHLRRRGRQFGRAPPRRGRWRQPPRRQRRQAGGVKRVCVIG